MPLFCREAPARDACTKIKTPGKLQYLTPGL